MDDQIQVRRASFGDIEALANVTLDCVAEGASIGFLQTLTRDQAIAFWKDCLDRAASHQRIVLAALDSKSHRIVGTVQLLLSMPDNQPHRGEIAKLQVCRAARGLGIAKKLMGSIENEARAKHRTLLVLDTVSGSHAFHLYRRLGWTICGEIPDYAFFPRGGLCTTTIFYKRLSELEPT